jgi:cytochrome c oxidase cbb3-type subunit 3
MNQKPGEDRLLDHSYDGIQEYDNPMPGWWVYLFWGTIAFAVLYWFNVPGIGTGRGRIANYEEEMARAKARQEELAAKAPRREITDASLIALSRDPARMEAAKTLWTNNCFACHRADGGGQIGPNLTDEYWIHGGRPTDIYRVVNEGVLEKGMPVWGKTLQPDQVEVLSAYVLTLYGTNPPNPKEPQGTKVEEGGAADSTHDHDDHRPEGEKPGS